MKKMILMATGFALALVLTSCGAPQSMADRRTDSPAASAAQSGASGADESSMQVRNPFKACESVADAETLAGFTAAVPEQLPEGYKAADIRAMEGYMIELICKNGDNELRFRQAKDNKDVSGDYNQYAAADTQTIGEREVTLKSNDGAVGVATWTVDEFAFSLTATPGLTSEAITGVIGSIQ